MEGEVGNKLGSDVGFDGPALLTTFTVGTYDGDNDGNADGFNVGLTDGAVGRAVGLIVGDDGFAVGLLVGDEGFAVGEIVGNVGDRLGLDEGPADGDNVGTIVGVVG